MLTNTQIKQARAFTNVSLRYREKLKRLKGGAPRHLWLQEVLQQTLSNLHGRVAMKL